jgi:hypothetical protein
MAVAQDDRPQFFQDQFLGPEDLTAAVEYGRIHQARHTLGAHTWGIAVGLQLLEKPSAAGNNQVDVFIQPGYACDGFGRSIVVLAPYKIPASLFQNVVFDQAQDGGNPAGRLIRIWLQYREAPHQPPLAGFADCNADGRNSRVQETFQVVAGDTSSLSDQRDPVTIGGKTVDAQNALTAFDPAAPLLYEASVPQQELPEDNATALWLIATGYVRWLPPQNTTQPGSFQQRNAADLTASEAIRQYIGVVAGSVVAAASHVRVRARGTLPSGVVSDDLFWVEGKTRLQDELRLFGGKLSFLDTGGADNGVPLSVQRFDQTTPKSSGLRVVIGKGSQGNNSLSVGTLDANNQDAFTPLAAILDNGRMGLGTPAPDQLLTLQAKSATFLNLKDSGDSVELQLGADAVGGVVSTATNHDLLFRAGGNADKMIIKANGLVGIGTNTPTNRLQVVGSQGIRQNYLYLSGDAGWSSVTYNAFHDQFNGSWTFPDPTRCAVTIEMDDAGAKPRFAVFGTSPGATTSWVERFHVEGDTGNVYLGVQGGSTGLGTSTPDGKLTISVPGQGTLSFFPSTTDVEYDGGVDKVFVFHGKNNAVTSFLGGRVGINTTTPSSLFDVLGVISANQYAVHSDSRLKRDIEPLHGALDQLLKLRGVRFRWKNEEKYGAGKWTGFVAQDVEKVFPEWVLEGADGYKLLADRGLGALLVEALRELKSEVDALRARIGEPAPRNKRERRQE